jgi:hypothetical protein
MTHQGLKRGFKQTNKIRFGFQIARRQRHYQILRKAGKQRKHQPQEHLPADKPELSYQTSKSRERGIDIGTFMEDNKTDSAVAVMF